jgi:hypothetical protein
MASQTTVSKAGRANDPAGHCVLKASGCGILRGIFQVGSMPHELTLRSMERFARDVMPAPRAEFP